MLGVGIFMAVVVNLLFLLIYLASICFYVNSLFLYYQNNDFNALLKETNILYKFSFVYNLMFLMVICVIIADGFNHLKISDLFFNLALLFTSSVAFIKLFIKSEKAQIQSILILYGLGFTFSLISIFI